MFCYLIIPCLIHYVEKTDHDSKHSPICRHLLDVAALPFEHRSLSCFDLLVPRMLLMSVSGSCCTTVIMWRCRDADAPHASSARLLFFFFPQASGALFVFIGAEAERSCGGFRTPYLTLGNCNLSWEEGVSLGDLPLNNYSHDKAINQAAPLPARLLSCFGENRWFICRDALLRRTPLARKPNGGAPLLAGGLAEVRILSQSQLHHMLKSGQMHKRWARLKHTTQMVA